MLRADPVALTRALDALRTLLGDRFSVCPALCESHGTDESWHPPERPDAVCFPNHRDEISAILEICTRYGVPLIPYGAGTSIEGQLQAVRGGISLDLSGMSEILRVSVEDLDCTVQPGVTRQQLNHYLRHTGLFFPVDPGADASIGGMTATRASGTNAVRYGTMRENVMGLEVVLASGKVIHTGSRARKSSAGYDLTHLMVGSEGTLGVMTEISLRLHALPETICSAVLRFANVQDAVHTVITTIQHCIPVARIELLDTAALQVINRYKQSAYPEQPTLFLEFHGSSVEVEDQVSRFEQLARHHGGSPLERASAEEDRAKLWEARHHAYWAAIAARPNGRGWSTDVCVPISRLADCIDATVADLEASFLDAPIVGHVGDGNFHVLFSIDPAEETEVSEAGRLNDRLIERALAAGGTCTGEHGIGLGKRQHLVREHGAAVAVMADLKNTLDPDGLLNPGKIFL